MKETLEKLDIFNPELWVEDGRWIQSPLIAMFFAYWYNTDIVRRIVPNTKLYTIFNIDGYAFQNAKSRMALHKHIEQRYKDDALKEFVEKIDTEGRAISTKLLDELGNDDTYIEKNIEKIINLYTGFTSFWVLTALLGDEITSLAKEVGYVSSEADLFAKVHPYLRETWLEEEVHDMRNIAEKYIEKYPKPDISNIAQVVEKDKDLTTLVTSYTDKFIWSRISKWIGESIDREYVYKRMGEEINNSLKGNYIKIHRGSTSDGSFDGVIALCVCSAYWRAQSAKIEMIMAYRLRTLLEDVGSNNGINYKKVLLLSPKELVAVFKDPNKIIKNKESILSREKIFFNTLSESGEEVILTPNDPEFAPIENLYLKRHNEKTEQPEVLRGTGASRGHARGVVRVIESSAQFDTFKEGEILVAAETSPTFVPLMRASLAILTGKGGITSHAAIVSRELGKPCIIAIKDVTRVLKTGDFVEVDADNGIVRKIK